MYSISITPNFHKSLKKFTGEHPELLPQIEDSFKEFITDPDYPALRLHKLDDGTWSLSLNSIYRIIFQIDHHLVTPVDIGDHDHVYN